MNKLFLTAVMGVLFSFNASADTSGLNETCMHGGLNSDSVVYEMAVMAANNQHHKLAKSLAMDALKEGRFEALNLLGDLSQNIDEKIYFYLKAFQLGNKKSTAKLVKIIIEKDKNQIEPF